MPRWRFLTARPIEARPDLGGIEQAVLNLASALRARGHIVSAGGSPDADVTIAVNDASLLRHSSGIPIVWFHNEVSLWREARRGRLPALLRHRPKTVFCGAVQARGGAWVPARQRAVIPHGLPHAILGAPPADQPPPPHAVFISQPYRGLAQMIALWRTRIAKNLPGARFSAFLPTSEMPRYEAMAEGAPSISILPRLANAEMPALLRTARVLLAPGHRAETFCLAAAEAVAMGVPVVTYGTGALQERVIHGQTGYICRSEAEFAASTMALLTDDALWRRMQQRCLAARKNAGWDGVAQKWEEFFGSKT